MTASILSKFLPFHSIPIKLLLKNINNYLSLSDFNRTVLGYTIEAAIPVSILGWDKISPSKSIGLNIRVFDDDNEINAGMLDHSLTWSDDPQNTSFWKTQYFNRITFAKEILSGGLTSTTIPTVVGVRDLVLELKKLDNSNYSEFINSVLNDMSQDNWFSALTKLEAVKDKVWSLPLLGVIQAKAEKFDDENMTLKDFISNSPDKRAQDWAINEIAKSIKSEVVDLIANKKYDTAIALIENGLHSVGDDNTDLLMTLGDIHSKRLDYYKARREYDKIIKLNPPKDMLYDAYINIGYLCFISGNTPDARSAFMKAKNVSPNKNLSNSENEFFDHFSSPCDNEEKLLWNFLSNIHRLIDEKKYNEIVIIYENTKNNNPVYMKYLSNILDRRGVINQVLDIYLNNNGM